MRKKSSDTTCRSSELHSGHICELESRQEWDVIRQVTDNPKVRCENCGAAANSSRNVCLPGEL